MDWKYYNPEFEYEEIFQDLKRSWAGHKYFAYDLVRNLKPGVIVELGTHKGTSFFSFCQAIKDDKLDTELNAVDTWKGDEHAGFYDESVFEKVKLIKDTYYPQLKIKLLRKTFDEALKDFPEKSIDLLHIDGLHTYEAVKHDYEFWINKVKEDGAILFHDVAEKSVDFGVYKLWDEIKENGGTIEFHHSHGLGILFRNPKKFKKIFDFQEIWKNYYSLVSENKLIKHEIDLINTEIREKDNKIKLLYVAEQQKNKNLAEIWNFLQQKDQRIANLDNEVLEKNQEILRKETEIKQKHSEIRKKDREIDFMRSSKFWKVRKLYIRIKNFRSRNFFELAKKGMIALKKEGVKKSFWYLYKYIIHGSSYFQKKGELEKTAGFSGYEIWIQRNEKNGEKQVLAEMLGFAINPKISVILPVFDADEIFLRKAIFSVINQYYQNWELCIVDNASTKIIIKKILDQFKERDPRIKVEFLEKKEELSGTLNRAGEMATGEFIAFLGQHDELAPNTLFEIAKSINENPGIDLLYSDEDAINENEIRFGYNFKPDWSPELILSQGYVGNFLFVRKELFKRVRGFREGFGGAEAYDFLLRLSEVVEEVVHIPKILYHKRIFPWQNQDLSGVEKGRQALESTLRRRMIKGKAEIPDFAVENNLPNYRIEFSPEDYNEKVTIIIPTKDKVDLLKRCIRSIKEKTNYKNYEILVIDNNSKDSKTFNFLNKEKIEYISVPTKGFNYSKIHNIAVNKITSELILFLNNDTEIISPNWLTAIVGTMLMDEKIGAVGARLIYGDKTIQHSGVIVGPHSTADHANKKLHFENGGYQNYNLVMRNYSAVTAACMLTKKSIFEKVAGFDDKNLAVAFNDIDYCLKLLKSGYRVVYNPDVLLYHHESKSRGDDHNLKEPRYFSRKWKKIIGKDPYCNINLSLKNARFELKNN